MTVWRLSLERIEALAWRFIWFGLWFSAALALAAVFVLTLGYDEAWILAGIQQILEPQPEDLSVPPVLTSGGVFAAGELLVTAIFGPQLWAQRLLIVGCAVAVAAIIWWWTASRFGDRGAPLAVSAFLATPGTLVLGSTVYATLPAFLMVLLAVAMFCSSATRWLRVSATALLAGMAAATRFECAVILPALCAAGWLSWPAPERRRRLVDAVVASALAAPTWAVAVLLYRLAGPAEFAHQVVASTGIAAGFDYPRLLNKWVVSESFVPFPMLALATAGAIYLHRSHRLSTTASPPWTLLAIFGWLAWAVWLIRAPIPHLRYLWPGLASFMILFGFAIAALYDWGRRTGSLAARLCALALAIACLFATVGSAGRQLLLGNTDILSWEWSGESKRAYFTRFRHVGYQRQAARYLSESTAPGERVLALGRMRSLAYLAQRPVLELDQLVQRKRWNPMQMPKRMVMGPLVGNFLYLTPEGRRWIEANTELEAQFGPYAFYRLTGAYPEDPLILHGTTEAYPGHPRAKPYR